MFVHIRILKQFYEMMFERVYVGIRKPVTPLPYMSFKHENEQPTTNTLIMDVVFNAKFKKTSSMLK